MIKKTLLIFLLTIPYMLLGQTSNMSGSINMNSEEYKLPQNKYEENSSTPYSKTKTTFRSNRLGYSYILSYHKTNFLNDKFMGNVDSKTLNNKFGTCLSARLEFSYPLVFDINWFSSRFEFDGNQDEPLAEASKIRHRGIELAANIVLLPSSNYFMPYVGLGYQSASIIASNYWPLEKYSDDESQNADKPKEVKYQSNCSTGIWKVGVIIGHPSFFINAEYKQSFNSSSEKAFNQFSVGLGIRYH